MPATSWSPSSRSPEPMSVTAKLREADSARPAPATPLRRRSASAAAEAGQVRVLARGLAILRAFTPRNHWLSNQEITAHTALPRPTVSRLTTTLTSLGYLAYSNTTGKYRLGTSVLTLGFSTLAKMDVDVLARPPMQQLADAADAVVVLASRDGMAMVAREVCHSSRSIYTLRVDVGSRLALPHSAMGMALLGAMTAQERAETLQEISTAFRKQWPELRRQIDAAIAQYTQVGFCSTVETMESGVNGIAVALDTPGAPHSYTIGLAGPKFNFPPDRLDGEFGPKLVAMKRDLETRLAQLSPAAGEHE